MSKSDSGNKIKSSLDLRMEIRQDEGTIRWLEGASVVRAILGVLPDGTINFVISPEGEDVRDAFV